MAAFLVGLRRLTGVLGGVDRHLAVRLNGEDAAQVVAALEEDDAWAKRKEITAKT